MGEKVGFMTVLLIFGVFVIPILFSNYIDNVKANKVLTASTEMQQLIQAEGGINKKVIDAGERLKEQGIKTWYAISSYAGGQKYPFDLIKAGVESNGSVFTDLDLGTEISIDYEFDGFTTSNTITILNRK